MRITYYFRGKEEARTFDRSEVLIGRLSPLSAPDLDLGADAAISRKHARIRVENGQYFVEDLKSTNGTIVNGDPIERAVLLPGAVILIGETTLKVEIPVPGAAPAAPPAPAPAAAPAPVPVAPTKPTAAKPEPVIAKAPPAAPAPPKPVAVPRPAVAAPVAAPVLVSVPVAATTPAPEPEPPVVAPTVGVEVGDSELKKRLAQLFELPLRFTPETRLDTILQTVLQRVVELIPGGERGALLLLDRNKDKLILRASVPQGELVVSENLARRVMAEGHGFILQRKLESAPSLGTELVKVETGMYAPLLSKERPLGAIYVDSPTRAGAFTEDDMQLLLAAAHYLAVVVYNHELQEELKHNSALLDRVAAKFAPRIQERLLESVRTDKLHPGGMKSEVTMLYAEIRGFAKSCGELDPNEVVSLLNEYYPALIEAIFRFDGTIERFAGDAIVAVFGSPENDPQHHEKAVLAALAMQAAARDVRARRTARGAAAWDISAGLHCGEMLNGFVGTPDRMIFTVLGDVTPRAIAYCNGAQNGEVLIGPELFQKVFKYVEADRISVPVQPEGELAAYRVKNSKA